MAKRQPGRYHRADVISVAEAMEQLFKDAKAAGIGSAEIEEHTGSVYEPCSTRLCITSQVCPNSPCHRERSEEYNPNYIRDKV